MSKPLKRMSLAIKKTRTFVSVDHLSVKDTRKILRARRNKTKLVTVTTGSNTSDFYAQAELKMLEIMQQKQKEGGLLYNMIFGINGEYRVIGENLDNKLVAINFCVKNLFLAPKEGKPAMHILIIEEVTSYAITKKPVYIPHFWLLQKKEDIPFVAGKVGQVQEKMITFLQTNMVEEIASFKDFQCYNRTIYRKLQQAKKAELR